MPNAQPFRRLSYFVLCAAPAVIAPLAGARPLRIPGLYQALGAGLFTAIALSAWRLSRAEAAPPSRAARQEQLAGALLLLPFALIALLWVGLGTPWEATPDDNAMRYAVLLAGSVSITTAFFLLAAALHDEGERLASVAGLATGCLSGAAYVVWTSFQLGYHAMTAAQGELPPALRTANNVLDALLFAAGALAYVATAAFAHALGSAGWLGRPAARVFVLLNLLALVLLALRGVSFPVPGAGEEPWYTRPGFIVGIPALPWIVPYLLGATLLRRAGDDRA
jgi:hypothetical protein